MKPTTINVQITKCPKQYEAVRLGMECTVDAGETVESAIKAATEQLTAIYEDMINPKPAAAPAASAPAQAPQEPAPAPAQKERLEFGDKRVQQIVRRMHNSIKHIGQTHHRADAGEQEDNYHKADDTCAILSKSISTIHNLFSN